MKLAFSTLACANWTLEQTLQICTKNKIDAIEIRLGFNDWAQQDMSPQQADALAQTLQAHQVAVSNLGTGIVIREYDETAMTSIAQCSKLASALHAKGLRIMLGTYKLRYSDDAPQADFDGIVRWLKQACALVQKDGVEIWLETHNEFASGQAMRKVLDAVQAPNLKILWDVIHPLEVGESFAESVKYMGQDIAHVHVKDGKPWGDSDLANWEYTRMGEGEIALAEFAALLERQGYQGYYSLEWESAWRPEIRGEGFEGETVIPHFAQYFRALVTQQTAQGNQS